MQMWYTYELSEIRLSYKEYCTHLYMISAECPGSMTLGSGEGPVLYLYMIQAESPGSMMLEYVQIDVYCTCIWSQLCLQAAWNLDMV